MNAQLPFYIAASFAPIQQTWSLRTAEQQYVGANGETRFHSFAFLADESAPRGAIVLDELHFVPVLYRADGSVVRANRQNRSDDEFLGAAVYRKAGRRLGSLPNIVYDQGTPAEMLRRWNTGCRVALQIAALNRPFNAVYNCRSGTRTMIEKLGYTFRTFADPVMQIGMNSPLSRELGSISPAHTELDPAADYERLRPLLSLGQREALKAS